MKYKKSILLIAFLMLVIFLPFVSANELENGTNLENVLSMDESDFHADVSGDVNDDSLANSNYTSSQKDDSKLGYSGGEEVLDATAGEYSYEDLKKQINSATGYKITLLKGNYRYGEYDGNAIQINKPCEIDGMGSAIYMGLTGCRAFEVSAPGVTFKNLTIFNAQYYGGHGVAIYFSKDGTLLNCNFINSKATGPKSSGGAVYFTDNGTVSNCNFIDNNAISMGGAVYFAGTGTVSNSNFTRSSATDFGGAIYFSKDGNLLNCNFINNKATGPKSSGGAVYFAGTGTVSNCNFTASTATDIGGAIYMNSGTVSNSNFIDSDSIREGGAVYFANAANVSNSNFTHNTASGCGGAIYSYSGGTLENCNFADNQGSCGGAFYFEDKSTVKNCNFANNTATKGDGGAFWIRVGIVENCNFNNNKVNGFNGGAFYVDGDLTIKNSNFANNTATKGNGGAFCIKSGIVENCNFFNNEVTGSKVDGSDGMGGAVMMKSGSIKNCNFTANKAYDLAPTGGAVRLESGSVTNCNFVANAAMGHCSKGGAIKLDSGTMSNCNFTANTARDYGGAVYFAGTGSLSNCNFTANDAMISGGAVYFAGTGSLSNCNFTANDAMISGGAIYVDSSCPNIIGCIFTKNTAMQYGGAIYLNSRNNVVEMCVFDSNSADDDGGAIYVEARYNTIKNSTFVNNKAKDEGGAVYINGRYGKIVSSSFLRNSAKKGYDIYCDSSYCELYCSIILGNTPKNAVYSSKSFSVAKNWWGNLESNRNVKPDVNKKVDLENNWLYLKDEVKYDHTGLLPSAVVKTSIWSNKFNYEVTDCQNIPFDMQFINTVSNQNTMRLGDVSDFIIPLTTTNTAVTLSTIGLTHKIDLKYDSSFYKRSFSHLKYDIYNSSSVLNLTSDYEYMDICDRILINGFFLNKELVIDGNGHTIDGKNIASLFEGSSAKNLTLKNINFVNIKNIYKSNGNIYIENCTFNNCGNGLELLKITSEVISIKNSKFYNCSSNSSIFIMDYYGLSDISIVGCEFIGNNANYIIDCYCCRSLNFVQNIFLNNDFSYFYNFNRGFPSRTSSDFNWFGNTIYDFDAKPRINIDLNNWMVLDLVNDENTFKTKYVYLKVYNANSKKLENNTYLDVGFNVSSLSGVAGFVDVVSGRGAMDYTFALKDVVTLSRLSSNFSFYLENYLPGSFSDLQYQINNAVSVLNLARNYEYMPACDSKLKYINIDKPLILYGNGFTIDAKGMANIARITGSDVQILNTTFSNSKGSAIQIMANSVLINSTFINNTNLAGDGGAIKIYGSNNVVIDSTFIKNTAKYGGAISIDYSENVGIDSIFMNNTAILGGAIYSAMSEVSISGVFANNSAKNGAAIYISASSDKFNRIYKSLFISNRGIDSVINVVGTPKSHVPEVSHSIFIDNNCLYDIASGYKDIVYADYNWFGNTNENYNVKPNVQSSVNLNRWLFLDVNANSTLLEIDESAVINLSLNKAYDPIAKKVYNVETNLPAVCFDVSSVNNAVVLNKLELVDGKGNVSYVPVDLVAGSVDFKYYSFNKTVTFDVGVPGDSFTKLQEIINNASVYDSIVLNKSYKYYPKFDGNLKNGIVINKSLKLNGNGHVIDGANQARLFNLTTNSIELYNFILVNGYAEKGSVIYTNASGDKLLSSIVLNSTGSLIYCPFWFAANENWFGNTVDDYDVAPVVEGDRVELNNWLFLTVDVSKFDLFVGEPAVITLNLTNMYDATKGTNSTFTGIIPVTFELSCVGGDINVSEATLIDGVAELEFIGDGMGPGYLEASYYNVNEEFYFNVSCDDDSFTALQKLIDNAKGKIVLQHDYRYYDYDEKLMGGILINKSHIEIDGDGHVIDALNKAGVFNITGEYVAVYNVSIVNSKNSVSVDGGYAVVDNVSFINNADVISVVDGTMEIVGCYFLNNSNVVDLKSAYDVFISDSTFINNTDIINTFYSTLTVNNTSFKGSDAGSYCVNLVDSNANIYSSKFDEINLINPIFVSIDSEAYLSKNILSSSQYIDNEGTITSKTRIVISGEKYYDLFIHDNLTLNATVYDDNGNIIKINDLEFNIDPTIDYNESSQGTEWILDAYCYPSGEYEVSASVIDSLSDLTSDCVLLNVSKFPSSVYIVSLNNITWREVLNVKVGGVNLTSAIIEIRDASGNVIYQNESYIREFNIESLDAGIYNLTCINVGDDEHASSSVTAIFEVYKIESKVVIEGFTSIDALNDYQINFNVFNRTDVIVTIADLKTGKIILNTNVSGDCIYVNLLAGVYNLTVTNIGDKNHKGSSDSLVFDVLKVISSVALDDVVDYLYDDVLITYEYVNATEVHVVIWDDVTGEVKYNFTTTNTTLSDLYFDGGRYNITICVEESESSTYSSDSKIFNVLRVNSSIAVEGLDDYVYGDDVEADIVVDNRTSVIIVIRDKSGKVVFNESVEEDYLPMPDLSVGEYTLVASNLATENVAGSNYTKTFTISKANSTIDVYYFNEAVQWGYGYGVIFDGDNITNISVIVRDADGNVISGGNLTYLEMDYIYVLENLSLGNYTIDIINLGNENITGCNVSWNFTVFKGNSIVEIENIYSVYAGEDVFIEYYVLPVGIVNIVIKDSLGNVVYNAVNVTSFNITVSGLPAGDYTVNVTNLETDNVFGNYSVSNFTVFKYNSVIILDEVMDVVYGENVLIGFDVENPTVINVKIIDSNGNVVYDENETDYGVLITDLDAGDYTVNVTNLETFNVTGSSDSKSFKVLRAKMNLAVSVDDNVYGEVSVVKVTSNIDGNYSVEIGDEELVVNVVDGQGIGTIALDSGNYTAKINFADDNYDISIKNDSFTVFKANVTAIIEVSDEVYGCDVTGNVFASVDGDYTVIINNKTVIVNVNNGIGSFNIGILNAGTYNAFISFNKTNYNPVENKTTFKVTKAESNIKIVVNDSEITYGDSINVTQNLPDDATGSITYYFANGTIIKVITVDESFILAGLNAGTYTIYANYSGDTNYAPAQDNITISVAKASNEITVYAQDVIYGEDVTITIIADADGEYNTNINGKKFIIHVLNGIGTVNLGIMDTGNYTVQVRFTGNDNYNASANKTTFEVIKTETNFNIIVNDSSITYGDPITVIQSLPGDATGSITYYFANGTIIKVITVDESFILAGLNAGTYTIYANYSGDTNYAPAQDNITITVAKASNEITVYAPDAAHDENALIIIIADVDGEYNLNINGKKVTVKITNGIGIYDAGILNVGKYNILVNHPGNKNINPSNASTSLNIVKTDTEANVTVPEARQGENVTINVELPNDATGNVKTTINGKTYSSQVKDGKATITIPNLVKGEYNLNIIYSGDKNYNPTETKVNVTVKEGSDIISAPDVTKYYSSPERFTVKLTDYLGNPLANKTVTITINNAIYTRTTDANGIASIALGLNSGTYNVTTTANNQSVDSVVTILPTIYGKDIVKVFRNATAYYATFLDSNGKTLAEGSAVTFNINGVMYTRYVDSEGKAKLNINLQQGKYIITAINPVTGERHANNITVLSLITGNSDLVKYYRNDSQYVVTILGNDGNPVGAGETVTFNINGVFYTRQTNASGQVKLNINLNAGDYIITTEYKGCMVANNIKVLPILSAEDIKMKYRDGTKFVATLVDGQGKAYAYQTVQFNINGILYNRITDSAGQAKLNINLMAGEYIITSNFNGYNIANKITISS